MKAGPGDGPGLGGKVRRGRCWVALLALGLGACAVPVPLDPGAPSPASSDAGGRVGSAWSSGPTEPGAGAEGGPARPEGPLAAGPGPEGPGATGPLPRPDGPLPAGPAPKPDGPTVVGTAAPSEAGAGALLGEGATPEGPWRPMAAPAGVALEVRDLLLRPEASTAQVEAQLRGEAFLVPTPTGGAWLIWNQAHPVHDARDWGSRIQALDADLKPVGEAIAGPSNFLVAAVCALPGGGFGLLGDRRKPGGQGPNRPPTTDWSERYDCECWCFRFDAQGQELRRSFLIGAGRITDHQATARDNSDPCLRAVGEVLHAFIPVTHNFAEAGAPPDRHQTDWYARVDAQGQVLRQPRDFWFSSHSSGLVMATTPQGPATLSSGDGAPFGLVLTFPDGSADPKVVWKPDGWEEAKAVNGTHTMSAGYPGGLNHLAGSLWLSFNGGDRVEPLSWAGNQHPRTQRPMLLELKGEGLPGLALPLDEPVDGDEFVPSAPLGPKELLVAWGSQFHPEFEGAEGPKLAVFDPQRKAISVPAFRAQGLPFSYRSPFATLADGSVAWAVVQSPRMDLAQVVRVRRTP